MPRTRKKMKAKTKAPVAVAAPVTPKVTKRRGRRRGLLTGLGHHEHERDILDQYLHEVSKTPLLTQKEEIALARKVRAGDQEAMQELVKRNLRFVISVAKKYQNRGLPLADRALHRRGPAGYGRSGDGSLPVRRDRAGAQHAAAPRRQGAAVVLRPRRRTRAHARRNRRHAGRHSGAGPSTPRSRAQTAARWRCRQSAGELRRLRQSGQEKSWPLSFPAVASPSVIDVIGRRAIASIEAVGRVGHFVGDMVRALPDVRTWIGPTIVQMRRVGVDSLPVAIFIAAFTGVVLALQASYTFTGAVPLYFVGTLVGKTMMLELGPVLAGLALAGRVVGLGTRGGAEGVGRSTTRAVVYSAILILVLDAFWAVVLL